MNNFGAILVGDVQKKLDSDDTSVLTTRSSFAVAPPDSSDQNFEDHKRALEFLVNNAKIGPFKQTAKDSKGNDIYLPYYLNAGTNMMDFRVAKSCARLMIRLLRGIAGVIDMKDGEGPLLCVGPEMAGGILVGQMACLWEPSQDNVQLEFVYKRKKQKETGTQQELEGPKTITSRTPDSPRAIAVLVDDVLATGSSLVETSKGLKERFNIEVRGAIFLVDRSKDREKNNYLEKEELSNVHMAAEFDLKEIHAILVSKFPDAFSSS
jgi:orotate phosphoribosyltransferase